MISQPQAVFELIGVPEIHIKDENYSYQLNYSATSLENQNTHLGQFSVSIIYFTLPQLEMMIDKANQKENRSSFYNAKSTGQHNNYADL